MANFQQLFPTFLQKCAELHELLRIVAFMLFIVGTILQVLHGFTGKTLILHMVRLFVLTALLVMLPQWGNEAQRILQTSISFSVWISTPFTQSMTRITLSTAVSVR